MGQRRIAQRQVEERAAIQAVAEAHRDALLQQHPELRDTGLDVLIVPGFNSLLQPMDPTRRETLQQHIQELLATQSVATEAAVTESTNSELVKAACSTCRGFCCRKGGDSAYLTADTIARVRMQHPAMSDADIASVYSSSVPETSMAHSCVFHGEQGCSLQREFRAQICNDYHCDPLDVALKRGKEGAVSVVAIEALSVQRSAVVRVKGLVLRSDS
jgi:hypothetical protein